MTDHIPLGWICPRCGRVWAPTVLACECEPEPADVTVLVTTSPFPAHLGFVETRTDA